MEIRDEIRFRTAMGFLSGLRSALRDPGLPGTRVHTALASLRGLIADSTVGLRGLARIVTSQLLGRTVSGINGTSISNIGVGLLPEAPILGHGG